MTKKNKILTILSVVGFLLLIFVLDTLTGNWSSNSRSIFNILWDEEFVGIVWPIIFILGLIVYLFLRKKDHTGIDPVKKTLWTVFVVLGLVSFAFALYFMFLIVSTVWF